MQFYKNILTRKNLLYLTGAGCYITSFNQYKLDYEYDNYYKNLIFILIK